MIHCRWRMRRAGMRTTMRSDGPAGTRLVDVVARGVMNGENKKTSPGSSKLFPWTRWRNGLMKTLKIRFFPVRRQPMSCKKKREERRGRDGDSSFCVLKGVAKGNSKLNWDGREENWAVDSIESGRGWLGWTELGWTQKKKKKRLSEGRELFNSHPY